MNEIHATNNPPLPPPQGYESWLDCCLSPDREMFGAVFAREELAALRAEKADLELKCALANAQVFNLKTALERIQNDTNYLAYEMRAIAAEALKGLE